jgi:hypothetical protein
MDPRNMLTDEELKMLLADESELKSKAENSEQNSVLAPRSSKHKQKKSLWSILFKKDRK